MMSVHTVMWILQETFLWSKMLSTSMIFKIAVTSGYGFCLVLTYIFFVGFVLFFLFAIIALLIN